MLGHDGECQIDCVVYNRSSVIDNRNVASSCIATISTLDCDDGRTFRKSSYFTLITDSSNTFVAGSPIHTMAGCIAWSDSGSESGYLSRSEGKTGFVQGDAGNKCRIAVRLQAVPETDAGSESTCSLVTTDALNIRVKRCENEITIALTTPTPVDVVQHFTIEVFHTVANKCVTTSRSAAWSSTHHNRAAFMQVKREIFGNGVKVTIITL